jgi:tetratricopeptide (TPR) repeat protein
MINCRDGRHNAVATPVRKGYIMNTLRSCAAALLLVVPTGIWVTAVAQTDQISVDRETCIKPNSAAPDAAIAACTRLLDAPSRGEISGPEGAAVHVARGNLHAIQGNVDGALADYDRAITLDPNHAVAFFNRAGALAARGQIDRALADYDRAVELDPTDADAHVGRGRLHYQKKDYTAAVADYDAALRLVPGDP